MLHSEPRGAKNLIVISLIVPKQFAFVKKIICQHFKLVLLKKSKLMGILAFSSRIKNPTHKWHVRPQESLSSLRGESMFVRAYTACVSFIPHRPLIHQPNYSWSAGRLCWHWELEMRICHLAQALHAYCITLPWWEMAHLLETHFAHSILFITQFTWYIQLLVDYVGLCVKRPGVCMSTCM